jgi:tRNA dimethylallyltransferase
LIVVGPTASGKTGLSLQIAEKTGGEVVSADSRQLYRYMDIGTAKPTVNMIKSVPHHMINILNPDNYFSAGEYAVMARDAIREILSRKKRPIVVGGSGLYIRALVDGVFEGNYRNSIIRARLKSEASESGVDNLYQRLKKVDPQAVQRIYHNDLKRIIRALEVFEITGEPISEIQKLKTKPCDFIPVFWGLRWSREDLIRRIDLRVDQMIADGLVDEVRQLLSKGYMKDLNSMDSVGYKEVFSYLNGDISQDEMVEFIKKNTRRYAKRQMTWFRSDERIQWLDLEEPVDWKALADLVLMKSGLISVVTFNR